MTDQVFRCRVRVGFTSPQSCVLERFPLVTLTLLSPAVAYKRPAAQNVGFRV